MRNIYSLNIRVEDNVIPQIDRILSIQHTRSYSGWVFEIAEEEEMIDYIDFFLNILEGKYATLEQIGVTRDKISICRCYEYDQQCNFEFSPKELKRMGDNGIVFYISCWDTGVPSLFSEKLLN